MTALERDDVPVLVCEGVGKRFGSAWVLRDVSFEVRRGDVLGLIGPGGHGKSVLLKLMVGLLEPDAGAVHLFGKPLAKLTAQQRMAVREEVGYLFQNYALFDFMTVFDNVSFPLRQQGLPEQQIEARVMARLDEVGLGHARTLYPSELSGGMKKRVGVARATITEAPLVFYDDPTAGLDPVTSSKIFQLVARMASHVDGAASLIVSHDIDRLKVICTRYLMIHEGRVVFDGPEERLRQDSELAAEFFFGAAGKNAGSFG